MQPTKSCMRNAHGYDVESGLRRQRGKGGGPDGFGVEFQASPQIVTSGLGGGGMGRPAQIGVVSGRGMLGTEAEDGPVLPALVAATSEFRTGTSALS